MFKLHVTINADLCMLPLLCLAEQMILLHIGNDNSIIWFKILPLESLLLGTMHVCSENLLTTFSGWQKNYPAQDAFHFYLSQLRICIKQTFGMMTTKWRILCQPLQVCLKNVGKVFMCISSLQNFCINEGCVGLVNSDDNLENEVGYIPSDIS